MRASIVIASFNEGDLLWKTVRSCVETVADLDCEIVVVDDASDDHTARGISAALSRREADRHSAPQRHFRRQGSRGAIVPWRRPRFSRRTLQARARCDRAPGPGRRGVEGSGDRLSPDLRARPAALGKPPFALLHGLLARPRVVPLRLDRERGNDPNRRWQGTDRSTNSPAWLVVALPSPGNSTRGSGGSIATCAPGGWRTWISDSSAG